MKLACETHPQNKAKAVCHHCGRPLCSFAKLDIIRINPFYSPPLSLTLDQLCGYQIKEEPFLKNPKFYKESYHCENCLIAYHPHYRSSLQRLKKSLSFYTE